MFPSVLALLPRGGGLRHSLSSMAVPQRPTCENDSGSTALGKYFCLLDGGGSLNISVCEGQHYSVGSYSGFSGVFWLLVSSVGFYTSEVDHVEAVPIDPEPSTRAQKDLSFLFSGCH